MEVVVGLCMGIDREHVECLIRDVNDGLDEVRRITSLSLDDFIRCRSLRFALRYAIVLIVESSADIGLIILKQCFDDEAGSYREVFTKLAERGVLSFSVAEGMTKLASLRNMIVHRYWGVDDARIYKEAKSSGIGTVEEFVKEVRKFISKDP